MTTLFRPSATAWRDQQAAIDARRAAALAEFERVRAEQDLATRRATLVAAVICLAAAVLR